MQEKRCKQRLGVGAEQMGLEEGFLLRNWRRKGGLASGSGLQMA